MIVNEKTFETDSFKQLLTKRSQKCRSQLKNFYPSYLSKDTQKSKKPSRQHTQKQNKFNQQNQTSGIKLDFNQKGQRKNLTNSSQSKSKSKSNTKLMKQYASMDPISFSKPDILRFDAQIHKFSLNQIPSHSKSSKRLINKKTKSMIRLPKYEEKSGNFCDKGKQARKSYSPVRGHSEGMKRTGGTGLHNVKTTKFTTEVKEPQTKREKIRKQEKQGKKGEKTKGSRANLGAKDEGKKGTKLKTQTRKSKSRDKPPANPSKKKLTVRSKPVKGHELKPGRHFQSNQDDDVFALDKFLSNRDSLGTQKHKTDRDSSKRTSLSKKNSSKQKQVLISTKDLKKLRNQAAVKIQKNYKGYITRKWLKQYLKIISASITIQRFWRGYHVRKTFSGILDSLKKKAPSNYALQNESDNVQIGRASFSIQQTSYNTGRDLQKWKDILVQVMGEKGVGDRIKDRIRNFLQNEESGRSSAISRNSVDRLKLQMLSQKKYFEKQMNKGIDNKQQRNSLDSLFPVSPSFDVTQNRQKLFSPRRSLGSHQKQSTNQLAFSPKLQKARPFKPISIRSPQQAVKNLYEIQQFQREQIISNAQHLKKQLSFLKQTHVVSPNSFKLKQYQIQQKLTHDLESFDQNIQHVIECCQQIPLHPSEPLITPEHSYLKQQQSSLPSQEIISKPLEIYHNSNGNHFLNDKVNLQIEQSQEQLKKQEIVVDINLSKQGTPTYYQKFQTFNINALSSQKSKSSEHMISSQKINYKKIDPSYNFIDEYLLTLIQFLRNKSSGQIMFEIVKSVKIYKNLSPYVVLRNLSTVSQENFVNKQSQGSNNIEKEEDDTFNLPLYKYLEDDNEILKDQWIKEFSKYFFSPLLQNSSFAFTQAPSTPLLSPMDPLKTQQNPQLFQHYLKLLTDCFNQALNLKRPSRFIFTNRSIESHNSKHLVERDVSDEGCEQQYDMYCASSMQDLYIWGNVKYGFGMGKRDKQQIIQDPLIESLSQSQLSTQQILEFNKKSLSKFLKFQVQKPWDEYYEMIEIIAGIQKQIFQDLMLKQVFTIMNIQKGWFKGREYFE